ncbi:MAG: translation elongation factor Ts [Anaerolineae bacterium]|nr:translation elongation factor Ts [Anaerolineae bacterium]NIN99422.1 translation elongation factor Ts [Anaerolineae bacterium]NIQ82287.1 translation elongation factor Ts [Anaerolineae bacterium]
MAITTEMVKDLRERTGAGVLDCKKALEEVDGDMDKAMELLQQKGFAIAAKKAEREVNEGLVEAYIHAGGKLGVLLELNCETDFVARTEDFRGLAHDLAMQVAATSPRYLAPEDIPTEVLQRERQWQREHVGEGKSEDVVERIVEGKLRKYYEEVCLLEQAFIKDEGVTVRDLVTSKIAKLGENIKVRRFARFELGEDSTTWTLA